MKFLHVNTLSSGYSLHENDGTQTSPTHFVNLKSRRSVISNNERMEKVEMHEVDSWNSWWTACINCYQALSVIVNILCKRVKDGSCASLAGLVCHFTDPDFPSVQHWLCNVSHLVDFSQTCTSQCGETLLLCWSDGCKVFLYIFTYKLTGRLLSADAMFRGLVSTRSSCLYSWNLISSQVIVYSDILPYVLWRFPAWSWPEDHPNSDSTSVCVFHLWFVCFWKQVVCFIVVNTLIVNILFGPKKRLWFPWTFMLISHLLQNSSDLFFFFLVCVVWGQNAIFEVS